MTIDEILERRKVIDAKIEQNNEILRHLKGIQDYIDRLNIENEELEKEIKKLFPMRYYPND